MNRSLRHVTRSPVLRVLACLAWLLLVMLPIHAQSLGMNSGMPAKAHAIGHTVGKASAMSRSMTMTMRNPVDRGHCDHTAPARVQVNAEDCCHGGDHGSAATCHCAATFGTALAAIGMLKLLPMMPGVIHPSPRETSAPDVADGPPLRPPAV